MNMDDIILKLNGRVGSFEGGDIAFEELYYVLAYDVPKLVLNRGESGVYDLNPVDLFLDGPTTVGGQGSILVATHAWASFDDFAMFTGLDPVDGILTEAVFGPAPDVDGSGLPEPWRRIYLTLYPPRDARFVVARPRIDSLQAGSRHYLDAFQAEIKNVSENQPLAYQTPRSIRPKVRPTRINLATRPTRAAKSVAGGGSDTQTLSLLVPGDTYVVSVEWDSQAEPTLSAGTVLESGRVDPPVGWQRSWIVFRADAEEEILTITGGSDFGFRKVLVEPGSSGSIAPDGTGLGTYFDGESGDDYLWGTPGDEFVGKTQSLFYEDRARRHMLLIKVLEENVPLGTRVLDPEYALTTVAN